MIRIIIKILVFFSVLFQLHAQSLITGKILDKNTQKPIAYANILISKNYGVLTNEDGEFSADIKKFKTTDSVHISYLGYKKQTHLLKNFTSKNYYLEENVEDLSEILISNKKLSTNEIIKKIKENASENYAYTNTKQQIFKRDTYQVNFSKFEFGVKKSTLLNKSQIKEVNKSINKSIQPFYNKTIKEYAEKLLFLYKLKDTISLDVIKAVSLVNKKESINMDSFQDLMINILKEHLEKDATYKVKTGFLKVQDSLDLNKVLDSSNEDSYRTSTLKANILTIIQANTVHENSKLDFIYKSKKYKFTLDGIVNYNDEKVYIIHFKPKRSSAKYSGTFYVNTNDFAIVKLNYQYADGKRGKKLNLKMLLGIKVVENLWNVSVQFQRNNNDKYALKMITQEFGDYTYINRPIKFTKNKIEKNEEKKMLKIGFKFELNQIEKNELYFVSEADISNGKIDTKNLQKEYKVIDIDRYTPDVWKGYNVLSPIKEIKEYDTGK